MTDAIAVEPTRADQAIADPTRAEQAPIGRDEVEAAARWLAGRVTRTPVLRAPALDRLAGARIWLKAENLQLAGSYKVRGALWAIRRIAADRTNTGVIALSTGNHAVAVALAARRYGLTATVVVPLDAIPTKVAMAEHFGARVVRYDPADGPARPRSGAAVVARLRAATGHIVIDAFDHPDVVAGQGSAALELIEETGWQGARLDALVVPVGGGGGVAGACLAGRGRGVAVYGVEPVGCDSLRRSLAAGRRITVEPAPTLADGLRPRCVGALPFEIARRSVAGVVEVADEAVAHALRLALYHAKVLVEPSAAAALAGALRVAAEHSYRDIGVVLTGGNVEPQVVSRLLTDGAAGGADSTASALGRAA